MNGIAIHYIALVFALLLALLWLMHRASRRISPSKPGKEKEKTYLSGEDLEPSEVNVPYESFLRALIKILRFEHLRSLHTGDLSTYLLWILMGLVLVTSIMVFAW